MKKLPYTPLTATPFKKTGRYREILPQVLGLAAYIRCFWGSSQPYQTAEDPHGTIVIPDTCADIIYRVDHTEGTVTGIFCGINDRSFTSYEIGPPGHLVSLFAIRFYAWSAYAFSEDSLKGSINDLFDVRSRFGWLDDLLRPRLLGYHSLAQRSRLAEELFLSRLCSARQSDVIGRAVTAILSQKGSLRISSLAEECCISSRQLERAFHEYIGLTPKKLSSLIRYQCLWNELLRDPGLSIADAAYRYGYADQPHLLREFKRYHTMDIRQAILHARRDVGNIQDTPKLL